MNSGAACGICGRKDFSDLIERLHVCSVERLEVDVELLLTLPDKMMQVQSGFTSTGGIHAAALFSNQGELLVNMEDIGRHNAVDKVIGHCIGENIDSSAGIICLSGRIGSELVLKAAAAMIPVIVAIGAASSMAIDLARQAGISLYGFTRNGNTVSYNNTQGLILKSDNRKQIGE
jgi:FdhD protein